MDFSLEGLTTAFDSLSLKIKRMQFGAKAQLAFIEDLYTLVSDGIPANRAIEMMTQVSTGITREAALAIAQKIAEGQQLAEGMRGWFSPNIVEIVRVGEEGGALTETLRSAIATLAQKSGAIGAFLQAVTYPFLVIIMACAIIIYVNAEVFKQFKTIKPVERWPEAGRDLITIAQFIQSFWWLAILVIIALVFLFRYAMTNYVGEFRPLLDKFFPFNLYRRFVASRFLETLGLLVSNGVVFKNALRVMEYQANPYLASHLMTMEHLLGMGRGNVADVLSTGLVNEADIMRLRIMAEVKGFEHGLVRMGIRGSEQNAKVLKLITRIFGGILLTIGALLIVIIIRGIYLTGMSMSTG
jgi:type II secretory pathway component PulF